MRTAAAAAALLLLSLIVVGFLRRGKPPAEPPAPYSYKNGALILAQSSRLASRLELVEVGKASEESREFRTVGQIVALSNESGSLTGEKIGWVELDAALSIAEGLRLDGGEPAGTAYGLTSLAPDSGGRVEVGQRVEITRYGLRRSPVTGAIVRVIPRSDNGERVDVVFRFSQAQDWFPGTNCEVSFPVLAGHPVKIPTTAPVHAGALEYVWKEVGPGRFAPQGISLIDSTPEQLSVLGLAPGNRIIARGSILLKPLLPPLLARRTD